MIFQQQGEFGFIYGDFVGIPNDRIGNLFKPFAQLDASYTRRFGYVTILYFLLHNDPLGRVLANGPKSQE